MDDRSQFLSDPSLGAVADDHLNMKMTNDGGGNLSIVVIDDENRELYVIGKSGSSIYKEKTSLDNINFPAGAGDPFTATFTPSNTAGGTRVAFEESKTGSSSHSTTVTTSASLTSVAEHLYWAAISTKDNIAVTSVAGLGLSWTLVKAQCAGRDNTGVEVWMAQGIPQSVLASTQQPRRGDMFIDNKQHNPF